MENRITKPFVGHLQSCQEIRRLPFFFDSNLKLVDAEKDTEKGELDIRVMHGKRPKIFFAFECKCLNVIRKGERHSQATKYVGKDGMGCFLSGQYYGGGDCGGMIGYVMDNNVKSAKLSINRALEKNKNPLKVVRPAQLKKSLLLQGKEYQCYETIHSSAKSVFKIYHVILPYRV